MNFALELLNCVFKTSTQISCCSQNALIRRSAICSVGLLQQKSFLHTSRASCFAEEEADVSLQNKDDGHVAKKFLNRNPRNLEFMGIAEKRKGWRFQYPKKEFYHRLVFERSHRHTAAYVEHTTGRKVVVASTKELAIMRHLYSATDVSAAENIGRVLARRCLETGITSMILEPFENNEKSEKFQAFRDAVLAGGVELSEPDEVEPDYEPGIDYDDPEAVANLERRQWLVYRLGEKSRTIKALNKTRHFPGRRRPLPLPTPLEAPSWR